MPSGKLAVMCGRYAATRPDDELASLYGAAVIGEPLRPSWNVAPTQQVRAIVEHAPKDEPDAAVERQLRTFRWGLVPGWAKDPKIGAKMINYRVETITEKTSFKRAAAARRCLLPSDGYYEWEPRPEGKQPFFLHLDEQVLSMAGLYKLWRDHSKDDDDPERWLWSATVITNAARDAAGEIQDRSPLIIPDDMIADWLDPGTTDLDRVREMVAAVPPPALQPYPVSKAVNSVRNNGPELLAPVAD